MDRNLAVQITSSLEAGDFERAGPLLTEYFDSLQTDLAQTPEAENSKALIQDALGLLHRWLNLSRIMRSHLNEKLCLTVRDASYNSAASTLSAFDFVG